ncbi:unnamed protein product [Effrenium voratum]|nr:unnamed protein product [Effrenium voratum]
MMKLLISNGADVDVRDRHGQTPLFFVPTAEACEQLSNANANLNILNKKGQSALHTAAHAGLDDVAKWLADHASPGLLNVQETSTAAPPGIAPPGQRWRRATATR